MGVEAAGVVADSDEWLVQRIRAVGERQDRTAFTELFRQLAPRFKAFALGRGVTPEQAEELAQESMIAVWRKAASFDPSIASPTTWLFTILRNKRIDMFRRGGNVHVALEEAPDQADDERHGPESLYRSAQARESVRRVLTGLSPEQRMVIERAFLGDKTHSELAEELGLPLGTVKSRIRLALQRMRTELSEARP